jgi:hypothetical protein
MAQQSLISLIDRMERMDAKILHLETGKAPHYLLPNGKEKKAFMAPLWTSEDIVRELRQLGVTILRNNPGNFVYLFDRDLPGSPERFKFLMSFYEDQVKVEIKPIKAEPEPGSIVNNVLTDLIDGMIAADAHQLILSVGKYPVYKPLRGQETILDNYEKLEYHEMMADFSALGIKNPVSGLYKRFNHISETKELSRKLVYHVEGIGPEFTVFLSESYAL